MGSRLEGHLVCVYNAQERVKRARSRLGEDEYNVVFNNCEHFVNWCFDGFGSSAQVGSGNLSVQLETLAVAAATSMIPVVGPAIAVSHVAYKKTPRSTHPKTSTSAVTKSVAAAAVIAVAPAAAIALPAVVTGYALKKAWDFFTD